MHGHRYGTRSVRGFQRTYEDQALGHRRRIDFLIGEYQRYQDAIHGLQPALDDDEQRLFLLDTTIRNTISELQQYAIDYDQEAYRWHQLVEEHQLAKHRSTDPWAGEMHDDFEAFFQRPELHPDALDIQFALLVNNYAELHDAVKDHARFDPYVRAGFEREASTPASEAPATAHLPSPAAASVQMNTPPRTASLAGSDQSARSAPLADADRSSPAPAAPISPHRPQVMINDDPMRHYYTDQSEVSTSIGRSSQIINDAYLSPSDNRQDQATPATHRGVPIVQQLDHGDDTTLSASPSQQDVYRYSPSGWEHDTASGIMAYTDGNVADASPIAWHNPHIGVPAQDPAYVWRSSSAPLAFEEPPSSPRPTRPAPLPPMSRSTDLDSSHLVTTNVPAGGRGPSSSHPSGPKPVDTAPPTIKAHSDLESASAFYRNATFHRDDKTTTPLVLKEIPVEPFGGDIRRYTTFRNRFLDIVEGHRDLAPRHKLQYLLQFLRGEPHQLASNFQLTDENYYAVVDLLEERYGNQDMIRNLLMADLIALRPPSQTVTDLRRFHGDAFRVTTDLQQLGDDVDSNRLYEQTLMSKLSPALKMELIRNSDYAEEKTASSILRGLNRYIQLLETTANTGVLFSKMTMGDSCPSGKRTPPGNSYPSGRRTPPRPISPRQPSNAHHAPHAGYAAETKNVPEADPRQNRTICALCGLQHWAAQCTVFRTISQRWRRARELKYCFLCLRGNHWAEKCPQRTSESCQFCGDRCTHHRALCRMAPNRNWTKGSPRRSPVRNTKEPEAPIATGGPSDGPSVDKRQAPVKTVHWSDSRDRESTAHGNVLPSAQRVTQGPTCDGKANSKKITRRKKSRSPGTGPQGRKGTSRPTTASTAEDMSTKGVNACDVDRLLSGLQSLLSTARCPPSDPPKFDRARDRAGSCASSVHDPDAGGHELWDEDESYPNWSGHCSNAPSEPFDAETADYDWFPPNEDPAVYAVSASIPADTRTVLLECAKVTAVNPTNGASREVTAFFDSGSNITYVSTALANDLDLPQQGRRRLRVNTFGSRVPLMMEGFVTNLVLRSRRGHTVSLNATAAPDCIVKAVTTALVEDHELPSLLKNEVTLISSQETPDILVGQDTVQLFQRHTETRLPNGFDLVHTILGPMIGGAGQVANPSNVDTSSVVVYAGSACPSGNVVTDYGARLRDDSAGHTIAPFPPPPSTSRFYSTPLPSPLDAESAQHRSKPAPLAVREAKSTTKTRSTPLVDVGHVAPDEFTDIGCYSGLVDKSDADIFGDFSFLENAGIGTSEMTPDDQAAADMLEKLITREPDGRYNVPLLFRTADGEPPPNNELPTNMNLGKGRSISTRNSLAKVPQKLAEYDGIIRDYLARGFISTAPLRTKRPKHCLSHHPVHKETSTTTATRPVYDASAKLPGRTCLNDWLYRGPTTLPAVPAILLRSRFPRIIALCDIGKAFLQVAVKESHRDCLWFVWFKDPTKEPTDDNVIFYRFDRVPFGLKSSPYLLAGVIKKHLESEGTQFAREMLKNCYVDNILLMADTAEEALQKYRESKAIFAKAQMPLREYASNNAQFNDAVDPADRADLNKLRELGIRWDVTADYWDIPLRPKPPAQPAPLAGSNAVAAVQSAPLADAGKDAATNNVAKKTVSTKPKRSRRKKVDDGRLTKRSMLRFVAQIFDPLGLAQAAILLAKLVIQEVWKSGKDWDDDVSEEHARLWEEAIRNFETTTIRIPRRIARGKIDSAEIHVFTDGSSQAYGCTAYLRIPEADGTYSTNLVYARAKVKPIKDAERYTIPRMELLGVLVGSRVIQFLHKELDVPITATYLWSDSTIVLHQVADTEKIKEVWVHNRLKEVRNIRDQFRVEFRYVPTDDNPADIVSRGLAAAELQDCDKWWHGAPFLALDSSQWPQQPSSLPVVCPSDKPLPGSERYGSTAFATLYADVYISEVPWRKLRRRKKQNPLDIITKPLPPTIYSASAVAAITAASDVRIQQSEGATQQPAPKLPSAPILPPVIGGAHFRWTEHVRITYYVLRAAAIMLRGARQRLGPRRHAPALGFALEDCLLESQPRRPSIRDLHITEMIIIRKAQLRNPPSDIDRRNLGIFEHHGLLHVKGRLGNMKLRPTALTPIYLPRDAPETAYIIMDYHRNNGHAGTNTTLANVRMRYWFTQGRRTIRKAIHAYCFECRREAMQPCATPPWPQLPLSRVSQTRPFYHTGLDFFGPVYLRRPKESGGFTIAKYSVAIFTCMTFRCVHLELCPDLSTQSFLDAFQRFGSRREFPARILSDNGLSFLTAREVIKQIRESHAAPIPAKRRNPHRAAVSRRLAIRQRAPDPLSVSPPLNNVPPPPKITVPPSDLTPDEERITDFCHRNNIEWQTITELSPWRGGSYERLIGIVKHSLKRSIGKSKPTEEQYRTLLACAERTTNCRPLSYVADSDVDFYLIRPIDFLIPLLRDEAPKDPLDPPTDPTQARDDPDFVAPGGNRLHSKLLRGLKTSRELADDFWQQFRDGVLLELRNRGIDSKRRQLGQNIIQAGDLVLVKEEGLPRTDWRLALVLELLPSADKLERSARIRFGRTHEETNRALEHLYPIGNVPARDSTTCSSGALEDLHSIFLISVTDATMDTAEPPVNPTSAASTRATTPSEPAPLAGQDSSLDIAPSEPAPLAGQDPRAQPQPNPLTMEPATSSSSDTPAQAADDLARYRTQEAALAAKMRLLEEEHQRGSQLLAELRAQLNAHADTDGALRTTAPPSALAVARADHRSDQENIGQTTTASRPEPAPLAGDEHDTEKNSQSSTNTSSHSEPAPLAGNKQSDNDEVWNRMKKAHAEAVAKRKERLAAAAAQRRAQQPTSPHTTTSDVAAAVERPPSVNATANHEAQSADETATEASPSVEDVPAAVPQPSVDTAPTAAAAAQPSVGDGLIPDNVLVDWTTMPAHLTVEEIWRRTRQFFSFHQDETGRDLARIDLETLASWPLRFPQESFFCIRHQTLPGIVDNSTWQPSVICCGRDEPNCFHVSVGATLIIIRNRWLQYKQIAARPDLQAILQGLMRLHVRSFGQMILLVYAARLAGDHDRMDAILKFLSGVLRARDLDYDIAQAIKRHVPKMIQGVDAKKSPYPNKRDFGEAAERWCNYCYKAFLYVYERLSGPIIWSPEWLRNADIPQEFKRAIDDIVINAAWFLTNLKERIYTQYVLRHIASLSVGDTFFVWTPLKIGRRSNADEARLRSRGRKWLLLVDEETDYAFGHELRLDKISIYTIPSTNREDVLRCVRNIMPGPDTDRVYIWFGREYISNGNSDYGTVVTEICHHYTTVFGHVHQYVVLPPYTRANPDDWTFDVLGLYLQRERLLPYARVVLHPYDVRLWHRDQRALQQSGELPPWDTEHQSANGTINNWSTIEARKFNLRAYHDSDLWTWYKKDHRAHDPPTSIGAHIGRNGRLLNSPYVDEGQPQVSNTANVSDDRPSEEPSSEGDYPSGNRPATDAAATTSTAAAATSPSEREVPPPATIDDVETAAVLLRDDNALLARLIEYAAKKAADQLISAIQPRIDDLVRRLDNLVVKKTHSATAEDRHKDPRTEH